MQAAGTASVARPERALVLGGAECVWDDVAAWEATYGKPWDGLIVCVNDIGCHWPRPFHHWVSLHTIKFNKWLKLRAELGRPQCNPTTWGIPARFIHFPFYADRVELPWSHGSSGMFGVQAARMVGCTHVIMCGIPMTDSAHFAQSREEFGDRWARAGFHWRAWEKNADLFAGWTKSMSGRTRDLLGSPTLEWLHESFSPEGSLIK
jgi:hypothetical protein